MKSTFKFLIVGAAGLCLAGCASRRLASQGNAPYTPPQPPRPIYTTTPSPGAIIVPQGGLPPGAQFPTSPNSPASPGLGGAPQSPTTPPPGPTSQFPVAPPSGQPSVPPSSLAPVDARDRVGYRWEPAAPPQGAPGVNQQAQSPPPSVLLLPPTPEPGANTAEPPRQEPRRQLYPPEDKKDGFVAPLPVGIAGFDSARANVTVGQRPSLEGLDWLQKSNVRTVVFLHLPGEATDADRQQVEKRNMIFVPIEINPRDLSRDSIDRFLRLQTASSTDKAFVYDLNGSISGAMWYLSFRSIEQDSDEIARIKAGSLGQGENRDASRELWQAVRKHLEQK